MTGVGQPPKANPRYRALLVAIENYAKMEETLAATLPETVLAATKFREWLVGTKGVPVENILFCSDQQVIGRTAGGTRDEIVDAIVALLEAGRDKTEQLYCFFSCHGFAYVDRQSVADVIVAADYRSRSRSGDACLRLDEIQEFLRLRMGPGSHYYFVDACRTAIRFDEILVSTFPLVAEPSALGLPTIYKIYSTQYGATAAVKSGFADVLLKGLTGFGRAKRWDGEALVVKHDSLVEFVTKALPKQTIDPEVQGNPTGTILEFDPVPEKGCEIHVVDAKPGDHFEAVVSLRGQRIRDLAFDGPRGRLSLVPELYRVAVTHGGSPAQCLDPQPVDLFEPATVRFTTTPTRSGPAFAGPGGKLTVNAPLGLRIRVTNLDRPSDPENVEPGGPRDFEAGHYRLEVTDQLGTSVAREELTVSALPKAYSYTVRGVTGLPRLLLGHFPHEEAGLRVGDQLIADRGLDMWLALLGAARIIGAPPGVDPTPLHSFSNEGPDSSPCYVLWGADSGQAGPPADEVPAVAVGRTGDPVRWSGAQAVPGLPGLYEHYCDSGTPGALVSLARGDQPVVTVATARLPNRVTFIVVAEAAGGSRSVLQFVLPMQHLMPRLAFEVRNRIEGPNALGAVATMVRVTREFAARRALQSLLDDTTIRELLHSKWLDPMMGCLGGYELARRGPAEADRWVKLVGGTREEIASTVIRNLTRYFPELPDLLALGRRLGVAGVSPGGGIPVFLEGYLALPAGQRPEPFPAPFLDYRGPWTQWVGAVKR
mgnify:FL=1